MFFYKTSKKQKALILKMQIHLEGILSDVLRALDGRGEYIYNEPGSGDVSYSIGDKRFEFNEFAEHFDGFFIDGEKVPLLSFLYEIGTTNKETA